MSSLIPAGAARYPQTVVVGASGCECAGTFEASPALMCPIPPWLLDPVAWEEGEEEEEGFITTGNWRGKHNSLSRGAGADQP